MTKPWQVTILSLYPEMFPGPLSHSIAGKALDSEIWQLNSINIRDFAYDKHKIVDDRPFGGGTGMVMKPDVVGEAIEHVIENYQPNKIIYMTPKGEQLTQKKVEELAATPNVAILCGRFEGIDHRILEEYDIEEISLGDFILSGGELPAMILIDACLRLIPGVISKDSAVCEESFGQGEYNHLLEYPHYTRPSQWRGREVPEILLSGNHAAIDQWRLERAKDLTKERRSDLWQQYLEIKKGE